MNGCYNRNEGVCRNIAQFTHFSCFFGYVFRTFRLAVLVTDIEYSGYRNNEPDSNAKDGQKRAEYAEQNQIDGRAFPVIQYDVFLRPPVFLIDII